MAPSSTGCNHIKNGPHVQSDGILYQERRTWTRSVGTKNRNSSRGGEDYSRAPLSLAAFGGFLLLSEQRLLGRDSDQDIVRMTEFDAF